MMAAWKGLGDPGQREDAQGVSKDTRYGREAYAAERGWATN